MYLSVYINLIKKYCNCNFQIRRISILMGVRWGCWQEGSENLIEFLITKELYFASIESKWNFTDSF